VRWGAAVAAVGHVSWKEDELIGLGGVKDTTKGGGCRTGRRGGERSADLRPTGRGRVDPCAFGGGGRQREGREGRLEKKCNTEVEPTHRGRVGAWRPGRDLGSAEKESTKGGGARFWGQGKTTRGVRNCPQKCRGNDKLCPIGPQRSRHTTNGHWGSHHKRPGGSPGKGGGGAGVRAKA